MKKSLAIAVGTGLLFVATLPLAQDMKAPASNPSATAPQSGTSMDMGSQMVQMDEHIQMLKALHERMMSATTPEARQIVMDKQREEMQGGMTVMNEMHQGDGRTGAIGGGMMAQKGAPTDASAQIPMMAMIRVMQKRMDMMDMMMQTMMDRKE